MIKRGGPASEPESYQHSEAESCEQSEQCVAGIQDLLRAQFLMFKYAFFHILETLFL